MALRLGRASLLLATLAAFPLLRAGRAEDPKPAKEFKFDPKEWKTNDHYPPLGDPRAKRDCKEPFVLRWRTFPPTLRTDGPNSRVLETDTIQGLLYETLIQIHPNTEEVIPCLATHWRNEIDEAKGTQTFWFRLDPRARFSDGSEVTAEDVHASWWHRTQEDREDPQRVMIYKRFEEPEILDKYTVRVTTKELDWKLFIEFGQIRVYPKKYIKIPGKQYLEEYNWKFMIGSGPYIMKPEDLKKGESLTLTRRDDYWAENEPWAKNTYNFNKIKSVVVPDDEIYYQTFKKGELDHFLVTVAQKWVEEYPKEEIVRKGWVKRRKVFNRAPHGFMGLAFNMREKPFDDKRVRLAFCYLFNRERLMEKLFFNQYEMINSFMPGRDWGNEDENAPIVYDPDEAAKLLAEAGYKTRDKDGFLVNAKGERLEVTFELGIPAFKRVFLVVKEDFEKGGIKFDIKEIDASTLLKKVSERQFKVHMQSLTGSLFPDLQDLFDSELADKNNNWNITGFKSPRFDELCKKYNRTFDLAEQKKIMREIDKLVYDEHCFALGWYARYNRILYWDRYGHPDSYLTKTVQDPEADMMSFWWYDSDRIAALDQARKDGKTLEQGEVDSHFWDKK
jgi:microcin C transport system substrate-binding protein